MEAQRHKGQRENQNYGIEHESALGGRRPPRGRASVGRAHHPLSKSKPPRRAASRPSNPRLATSGGERLPISIRLPNPPSLFVGRSREVRLLRAALERAPVTVIVGAGGLGKSALALFVLHSHVPEKVDATIYLSFRNIDPHEPVALGLLRALVRAGDLEHVDWAEILATPDALPALAVRLAEAQRRWILLDDLQHGDPAQVGALLGHAARYARESRWLVTTREAPEGDAALGPILRLGAMRDLDLARLCRALDPLQSKKAIQSAVERAEGSPWRLRRMQAGGAPGDATSTLTELSDPTRELLQVLRILGTPLPESSIERITLLKPGGVDALLRQGIVERASLGIRLHEDALAIVPEPLDGPIHRKLGARAASALATLDDAASQMEALRVLLQIGAIDDASVLLTVAGPRLLEGGYAPALWRQLAGAADPRLERFRLACAVELGDAAVLARVSEPSDSTPESLLLWARALLAKGQLVDVIRVARGVRAAAEAGGRAKIAVDAGLLEARATLNHAGMSAGLDVLNALTPPDVESAALIDAHRAVALASLGMRDAALARASDVMRALSAIAWPTRGRIGALVSRTLWELGRLREAITILDAALEEDKQGSARFDVSRTVLFTRAALALDAGDLDRARSALDGCAPYMGSSSLWFPYLLVARARFALAAGELAGIEELLFRLMSNVPTQLELEGAAALIRLALLRREPFRDPGVAVGTPVVDQVYQRACVELEIRRGERAPDAALRELSVDVDQSELRTVIHRVRAVSCLVAGRLDQALAEIRASIAAAREHGFRVYEAEAREVACDVELLLGDAAALLRSAAELEALGAAMPSQRFTCAARFFRAVAAPSPDPAELEAIAGSLSASPPSALRARALLGGDVSLDLTDRRVLGALSSRSGLRLPETIVAAPGSAFQSGWGVDEGSRAVWLPTGARVDLSRHVVPWRILCGLVERGGRATKEQLVQSAWSEREYHPLRHDNRLQAAIRTLRCQIEDDPSAPARVVTTDEGYALGPVARVVRASPRPGR